MLVSCQESEKQEEPQRVVSACLGIRDGGQMLCVMEAECMSSAEMYLWLLCELRELNKPCVISVDSLLVIALLMYRVLWLAAGS